MQSGCAISSSAHDRRQAHRVADPQYCLLAVNHWAACMTKAEWAAWVQAFGSIVALAVAVGLAWRSDKSHERQAERAGLIFGHQLIMALRGIETACRSQRQEVLLQQASALAEILALGRAVPMERLPKRDIVPHAKLRALAAEAVHHCKAFSGAGAFNFQHMEAVFKSLADRATRLLAGANAPEDAAT